MTLTPFDGPSESRSFADALRQMTLRHERLVRDLSILPRINEIDDPSLDVEEISTRLVEIIVSHLAAESCSLMLLDASGEFLELRTVASPFEDHARYFQAGEWQGSKFRIAEGVIGRVFRTGKPVRLDDAHQDPDFVSLGNSPADIRSLMCFPIRVGENTIGALNLSHASPGFFTLEDEKTIELVANRAGRLLTSHLLRQQLQASEEHYRLLATNAADAILVHDTEGRILSANPMIEAIAGIPVEAYVKGVASWLSAIHDEDRDKYSQYRARVAASGATESLEYRHFDREGTLHHIEERCSAMRDAKGNCTGVVAIVRDITARKMNEAEHQRLITAIEQAGESIVITDTRGIIEYVNPAFERTSGYSREEATGQNPRILKSGKEDPARYRDLWETVTRGKTWAGRIVNKKKDGSLYQEDLTISPVHNASGEITNFVAVKRDATREILLENQLRQAQKMEAVGQLAGGVAHDFNNLLQAIQGYTQFALDCIPKANEGHAFLEEVLSAADRASTLTRQLLTFSRREESQHKDTNLNTIILDTMKILRRLIGEHIELEFVAEPNLQTVCADAGQIGQVLINLCVNARDAMPEGGRIVIETQNIKIDSSHVEIHPWAKEGEYVLMSITDQGVGMSQETLARVFEPFFTTKEVGKGTGMGLATAYGITKQHGGMITAYSELGLGSTFKFYLPGVNRDPLSPRGDTTANTALGGVETILVAEDDESVRSLVVRILTQAGYRVIAARDGAEAVAQCREHSSEIDLAVLDVVMPKVSGRVACEEIRALMPGLPVLFSSGYSVHVLDQEFIENSGALSIQKPYQPGHLLSKVRAALDQGRRS